MKKIFIIAVICFVLSGCESHPSVYTKENQYQKGRYEVKVVTLTEWKVNPNDQTKIYSVERPNQLIKIDTTTGKVWHWWQQEMGNRGGFWNKWIELQDASFIPPDEKTQL